MKLWGGRFEESTDAGAHAYTRSLPFDYRLCTCDILGSVAHARMLGRCGILSQEEAATIVHELEEILKAIGSGFLSIEDAAANPQGDEDVHSFVERILTERIGDLGGKLHIARSRNDQVVLDVRMFVREAVADSGSRISDLQRTLLTHAKQHVETFLSGYTHLQHAQPVSLAHHLLAYFWMLQRDRERLKDSLIRVNVLPLGAAALAGTTFPIDREFVARELGFAKVSENSMDSVSDRDFILELLFDLSMVMMHLSRLCEELILWSSTEFGFVEFDDRFSTGSSIMPQKKNPDVAEITRGKTGRVYGDLVALLTVMKGLPLAYHSDMQEDKEALFDAVDTTQRALAVINGAVASLRFNVEGMRRSAGLNYTLATDLADYLANRGVPFREAHGVVGRIVRRGVETGRDLDQFTLQEFQQFDSRIAADMFGVLTIEASVAARTSAGGTAPERVREQIDQAETALAGD